jgi:N-acetylmuramoyl-L-alanine amidase
MATAGFSTNPVTGDQVIQLARRHLGERYVLGVLVPKDNPNWKGPWDCAEFVSWATFQTATTLYGCDRDHGAPATADAFTGFWDRDARNKGRIISIEQAARTPGAALLRLPQIGATGHIVISDGAGGTLEAHSPGDGVIQSTIAGRRWDMGILVPQVTYIEGPSVPVAPPATKIFRLTVPTMAGQAVPDIQRHLLAAGFDPGTADGEFGPHTHAAVVSFQLTHNLLPDGEVGPQTAAALGVEL